MRCFDRRVMAGAAVAVALAGCGSARPGASRPGSAAVNPASAPAVPRTTDAQRPELRGLGVAPVPRKPDFVLNDTSGKPVGFRQLTRGRLTYLYFGYTHCPDACPTTMADLAAALRTVTPLMRLQVAVVFVTTDPARDSGARLRAWLNNFDPTFIGLTGNSAQIAAAESSASVPLAKEESDGHGGYGVSHSSEVFAFSPDGLSHVVYADGFLPSDYAHDLPLLLNLR